MSNPKRLDWKIIDHLLEAGCTGIEIAGRIGISKHTLYERCVLEKKETFSVYSQLKRASGDSILRETQYDLAIDGDKTLLIFLGKTRLKQQEYDERLDKAQNNQNKFVDNVNDLIQSKYDELTEQ